VRKAIAALNDAPPAPPRARWRGDEMRLCLLFSNPSNSFLSELLMGSLEQASRHNALLAVVLAEGMSVEMIIQHLQRGRINGIVLPPPLCDSPDMLDALKAASIRTVTVAASHPSPDLAAVNIDDSLAAQVMTRHLIALGHRRIGFVWQPRA
jgi:LacI family transcriptional regulator